MILCPIMYIQCYADPPGTINPAKLSSPSVQTFGERVAPPASTIASLKSPIPRLPRLSSDWEIEHDLVARINAAQYQIRKEFEESSGFKKLPARTKAGFISHRGHFLRQINRESTPYIPVDPDAPPGATVVVDDASSTIYDVYMLRVDIPKNINLFRRHQVSLNINLRSFVTRH